jgi:hypothetical protein
MRGFLFLNERSDEEGTKAVRGKNRKHKLERFRFEVNLNSENSLRARVEKGNFKDILVLRGFAVKIAENSSFIFSAVEENSQKVTFWVGRRATAKRHEEKAN